MAITPSYPPVVVLASDLAQITQRVNDQFLQTTQFRLSASEIPVTRPPHRLQGASTSLHRGNLSVLQLVGGLFTS